MDAIHTFLFSSTVLVLNHWINFPETDGKFLFQDFAYKRVCVIES